MPILGDPRIFSQLISLLCTEVEKLDFDRILGIESRGFLLAPMMASCLNKPFGPIRKKGKLPGDVFSIKYDLEYGSDSLEVQKDSLPINSKCLIVDDLLATGGTMAASKKLIEMSGSKVTSCLVVIELTDLKGREKLGDTNLMSLFKYDS